MSSTEGQGSEFALTLSRSRATANARREGVDHSARWSVFAQAMRQMHPMQPRTLRRNAKLYNCIFAGERSHDAGGPYRESWTMYTQELMSTTLPLLVRVPNGRHHVGLNREQWQLNGASSSSTHMQMFEFMGKLMGMAIRQKMYLNLNLSGATWKAICQEPLGRADLEAVDTTLLSSLDQIRHDPRVTEENFEYIMFETFTTIDSAGNDVELRPGGANEDVTWDNRLEYCELVESYHLNEFQRQAAAVRRGLGQIVPARLLLLFSGAELETMVCGKSEFDVDLLESITEYGSGVTATDAHIRFFWQAMREFDNEERQKFLRFTWGRSRLPLTAAAFTQRLKIDGFNRSPADSYYPVAHTCFFSIEMPRYSTAEIMIERLRYAIHNCQAIDGDDTSVGMQAAGMGWEE